MPEPTPGPPDAPDADAGFAIPEVTRGLRALGSRRGLPGSDHDRFFAPLLDALRRGSADAERAAPGWTRATAFAAAFDAARIAADTRAALDALAADRFPDRAADRRALGAELTDLADDLLAALAALDARAAALHTAATTDADTATRAGAWRAWGAALSRAFAAADRCWLAALPALADSRGPRGRLWRRLLRRGGATIAVAALGAAAAPAHAGAQPPAAPGRDGDGRAIVRVSAGADSLDAAALRRRGFDVVPARPGELLVVADAADRARLEALGARVTVVRAPALPRRPADRDSARRADARATAVYRSFDDPARGVRAFLDSLARANPRVRLDTLGTSHGGRPILALQIGQREDAATRPNVLFLATYHAREWAATEMALRLARHLASPPAPSARLDSLLARRDVWIVPVVNPDGYEYTFTTDRLWRKNRRPSPVVPATRAGVDLNRNHVARWGADDEGSSPDPSSDVYRGPAPASEPEVAAIERFHARHPPVVSVSYHTYAGLVLHPPGWRFGVLPGDLGIYRTLAGTDERPAVRDLLPGALPPGYLRAQPAWQLYVANGEYMDFASQRHGALAFTPELTSGFEGATFYGFEFPDDEARLQRLFEDNLPFALDAIESAADPLGWASPTTGLTTAPLALESVSPVVRVRVPAAAAPAASIRADGAALRTVVDTVGGGRWMRRVVGEPAPGAPRPRDVVVAAPGDSARFRTLLVGGAEAADSGWTLDGAFRVASDGVAGAGAWRATGTGLLRSPVVQVPADVDTVTVALWARFVGGGIGPVPGAQVRISRDGGRSLEPLLTLDGEAPVWYPESRQVDGVRGRALQVAVLSTSLLVDVDEIAIVGHLARGAARPDAAIALQASDNPVRGDAVRFNWPFGADAGDLLVYDFAGRLVWRTGVVGHAAEVTWDVGSHAALANGVYLVIARAGDRVRRRTLYVLRPGVAR